MRSSPLCRSHSIVDGEPDSVGPGWIEVGRAGAGDTRGGNGRNHRSILDVLDPGAHAPGPRIVGDIRLALVGGDLLRARDVIECAPPGALVTPVDMGPQRGGAQRDIV